MNYDGKDHFYDPGVRFCPFEHLAWQHTRTSGIRQVEGGAVLAETRTEAYKTSQLKRVADLTMDDHGIVTGSILVTYSGIPAMRWRQLSVSSDEAAVRHDLVEQVGSLLPGGMQLTIASISALDDYEKPLIVKFNVNGPIGSPAGKRLLVPGALFESNRRTMFSSEKRQQAVDFDYGLLIQDAVRIKLPKTLAVESLPNEATADFQKLAGFNMTAENTAGAFTMRRNYALGEFFFKPSEYTDLRKFFLTMEAADQQSVVLKQAAPAESKGGQ